MGLKWGIKKWQQIPTQQLINESIEDLVAIGVPREVAEKQINQLVADSARLTRSKS